VVDVLPILGVCLGHQAIAAALGGKIVRAPEPMHGRASLVRHDSDPIFAGLPDLLRVGRYHSLAVDRRSLPDSLRIIAAAEDRSVMAIRHVARPIYGLQFHPESILTENGLGMIGNFLQCAGIESARRSEVSTDQKQGEISPTLSPTNVPFYY
ncbi:MAG: anthranilate synthase component II, partial [Blastopirellula sp. JB062]